MWTVVLKTSGESKLRVNSPVIKYWIFFYKHLLSFGVFGLCSCRFCCFFCSRRYHASVERESKVIGNVHACIRIRIALVNIKIWSSLTLREFVPDDISVITRSTQSHSDPDLQLVWEASLEFSKNFCQFLSRQFHRLRWNRSLSTALKQSWKRGLIWSHGFWMYGYG